MNFHLSASTTNNNKYKLRSKRYSLKYFEVILYLNVEFYTNLNKTANMLNTDTLYMHWTILFTWLKVFLMTMVSNINKNWLLFSQFKISFVCCDITDLYPHSNDSNIRNFSNLNTLSVMYEVCVWTLERICKVRMSDK